MRVSPSLTVQATAPTDVVEFDADVLVPLGVTVGKDAQFVVLAFGKEPMPKGYEAVDASMVSRVITNPIVLDGDGDGVFTGHGRKNCAVMPLG